MRVIDLSAEELRVDSKSARGTSTFVTVVVSSITRIFSPFSFEVSKMSSSRCCCCCFPDRISEQHAAKSDISTTRKTRLFVCVCVCSFCMTVCAYELCRVCCFFDFSIYIIKCLLLVRQSRRFEQTKRKNTLTTCGSAKIYVHARTLPWRLQIPFVQNSVFFWKRESMRARARARESLKKIERARFPTTIIVDPVIRVFVLSFATLCALCAKALVAPH